MSQLFTGMQRRVAHTRQPGPAPPAAPQPRREPPLDVRLRASPVRVDEPAGPDRGPPDQGGWGGRPDRLGTGSGPGRRAPRQNSGSGTGGGMGGSLERRPGRSRAVRPDPWRWRAGVPVRTRREGDSSTGLLRARPSPGSRAESAGGRDPGARAGRRGRRHGRVGQLGGARGHLARSG